LQRLALFVNWVTEIAGIRGAEEALQIFAAARLALPLAAQRVPRAGIEDNTKRPLL
jgi:hypothetical protein